MQTPTTLKHKYYTEYKGKRKCTKGNVNLKDGSLVQVGEFLEYSFIRN